MDIILYSCINDGPRHEKQDANSAWPHTHGYTHTHTHTDTHTTTSSVLFTSCTVFAFYIILYTIYNNKPSAHVCVPVICIMYYVFFLVVQYRFTGHTYSRYNGNEYVKKNKNNNRYFTRTFIIFVLIRTRRTRHCSVNLAYIISYITLYTGCTTEDLPIAKIPEIMKVFKFCFFKHS